MGFVFEKQKIKGIYEHRFSEMFEFSNLVNCPLYRLQVYDKK